MTYDAQKRPRRPAVRVPAYCLHRSSGRAYVTFSGSPVYLGPYGSQASKDRYDRLIAEFLASGRQVTPPEPSLGVSVNELLLAYLRHAQTYYRKASGEPTSEFGRLCLSVRELRRHAGRALDACRRVGRVSSGRGGLAGMASIAWGDQRLAATGWASAATSG